MSNIRVTVDGAVVTHDFDPTTLEISTRADMGEANSGSLLYEDEGATLTLVGHQPVEIEEIDCAQPRLFTGWTTQRDVKRDPPNAMLAGANARVQQLNIVELNAVFDFRQITRTGTGGGNRPAETWQARCTWILNSEYLSDWLPNNEDFIVTNTVLMDEADYRGETPRAVMDDLSARSGDAYTYFAFFDPISGERRLFFDNPTEYIAASTISISNVLSDVGGLCFAPDSEATLTREPDQVYSDVILEYFDGTQKLFRSRPSTYATYERRGTTIQRPYTKGLATATSQAEKWLDKHSVETDRIVCSIQVPSSAAGLVQAGQSISVKFSHMPSGYADFTTMRVVSCSPKPTNDVADFYDIALELVGSKPVPQECVTAVTFGDLAISGSHVWNRSGTPGYPDEGPPLMSITPATSSSCVLFAGCVMNVYFVEHVNWTSGSGWTTIEEGDSYDGHPAWATMYKPVASPSGSYTVDGTYTDVTPNPLPSSWAMGAFTIATDATSPVQYASGLFPQSEPYPYVDLPGAPTEGNAIVMVVTLRNWLDYWDGGATYRPYPDDGQWTLLGHTYAIHPWDLGNWDAIFFYVRCVAAGDGTSYGVFSASGDGAPNIALSEWTARGSADTTIDLGPTPGATTIHTTDPTVTDDADSGYTVGSHWINTTTGHEFVLTDSTAGAAVWVSTTAVSVFNFSTSDGVTTVDPTTELTFVGGTLADLGGGVAELTLTGINAVTNIDGGKEVVNTVAAAGATETLDLGDGNVHDVTLTADCTLTFAGATNGVACSFTLLLRQDGTGGWTTTWPGSVVWAGGSAPTLDETASTLAVLTFVTVDGGTTWLGFPTGSAGGTPATTVTDETTWGITPAVGSDTEYARQDHTHGSPATPAVGIGPILISDTPSTPLVFADLIQNEAEDDLVYADP